MDEDGSIASSGGVSTAENSPHRVRKFFPETWLWDSRKIGYAQLILIFKERFYIKSRTAFP